MNITHDSDAVRALLTGARRIAVVGHSDDPGRTSYQIAQYLRAVGYTVLPVNPLLTGIEGEPCYPSLAAAAQTGPIDIVNVFRRAEHLPGVVEEAVAAGAKAIWGQLGVAHPQAEALAAAAGLPLVMDLCIKVEHQRLVE